MKKYTLTLLLSTAPLFAGVSAPMSAPAPQSDCAAGWTLGLEALALRTYASGEGEGENSGGNYDFGGRASLGYQFSDCLFTKVTYFGYRSNNIYGYNRDNLILGTVDNGSTDLEVSYLDWVVGQHFKPSEKLTLSPYAGLRWGTFKLNSSYHRDFGNDNGYDGKSKDDFSGLGIVVGLDATRALANNFSLYGTAKQSILFGSDDYSNHSVGFGETTDSNGPSFSDDVVVSVSELSLGVQYDYTFSNVAANVRLGVEAQYWTGANGGNNDVGLAGFVLGANFRF